jgi:DNA-binding NarL/FixJ family response regulator
MQVIFMSGFMEDAAAQEGILTSALGFLPKQFTAVELARNVRTALEGPTKSNPPKQKET